VGIQIQEGVLLGFEVGTASPVYVPLHHLAIFGMTQLSGKTTALEALIGRSGLKAIAFITKRGEGGFSSSHLVTPYYKPRADWQFVEGLVNVALGEKVKYEPGMRYAIMKVCRGRKDLKEIQLEARRLAKAEKSSFMRSVYEKLDAYLDIVIPELEKWIFTDKLKLSEGINVMDLSGMRLETQHIVIASTIEYAFANLDHVIVIIPEAWETIPQGRMTPVKWVAQQFIRKGAALGNYLWLDSQDIGGIDKTPLRQCDNWLMGRMKEAHEVERILKQLMGAKIEAEEIQTLALGHFFAAIGNHVKKVYVLPLGVPEDIGVQVALGKRGPESVREEFMKFKVMENDEMYREKFEEEKQKREELEKEFTREVERLSDSKAEERTHKFAEDVSKEIAEKYVSREELKAIVTEADLNGYSRGKADAEAEERPLSEDIARKVAAFDALSKAFDEFHPISSEHSGKNGKMSFNITEQGLDVNIKHEDNQVINFNTAVKEGQVMYCIVKELGKDGFMVPDLQAKLQEHGWIIKDTTLRATLSIWVGKGYLVKTEKGYRLPSLVHFNVQEA
jgi:hypothetical protein